ncbi:translation initiation factor eIF3 subunit 135-domain-containing protein [Chytriomyces cf. hyalinus JEL632]|nr:translation initiation factor eIF3 subunit 135-domain-containing protein [Chytriomyces cf. hyalinus JEL632]
MLSSKPKAKPKPPAATTAFSSQTQAPVNPAESHRPVKQGWMLKKAGRGVFAQWKLKYMILATPASFTASLSTVLLVYDQCDQSKPPKYEINLSEADIDVPGMSANGSGSSTAAARALKANVACAAGAAGFGKKGFCPFVVYARQRKFHFAAQTKSDSDDWFAVLEPFMKSKLTPGKDPKLSPAKNAIQNQGPAAGNIVRSKSRNTIHSAHMEAGRYLRDEDAISVVSSEGSLYMDSGEDGRSSTSSSFETLSFCSEPVLTPHELLHIGNMIVPSMSRDDINRRRKAPMHMQLERTNSTYQLSQQAEKWNERYQRILSLRPANPDAALQKDLQLLEIIGAFEEAAVQHAMKMVDEHHLQGPRQAGTENTFSPSETHSAPGAMFVDGMILHFACDYDVAQSEDVESAISRTSSELRSIDVFNRAAHDAGVTMNTALMALIDYKGFRVVAYADMGIDERTTPLYDLRSHPLKCDEQISAKLALVGKEINLKMHGVQIGGDRRVNVPLSASIQVYNDPELKRNYAVNLFELLPMDYHPQTTSSAASSPSRGPPNHSMQPTPFTAANSAALTSSSSGISNAPSKSRRLRPEFLKIYSAALGSDAFTSSSGCGRKERELNDTEVSRASRYLEETWIPQVVKQLDELEVRPLEGTLIAAEMHRLGVNVRYLGAVAKESRIPYIRDMVCIEMAARAFKNLFHARLRGLMVHFRSVGATQVEEETKKFTASMFSTMLGNSESSLKFFDEKLKPEIQFKFEYEMEEKLFTHLHKPALFSAMQFHCGIQFEESTDYNFNSHAPCPRSRLVSFIPKRKHITGLAHLLRCSISGTGPNSKGANMPTITQNDDERLAYSLTRHFRSLGPKSKLQRSDASSTALANAAAHYNATSRYEEAKRYALASLNAAENKSTGSSAVVARAQVIEAMGNMVNSPADMNQLLQVYRMGVTAVKWTWGLDHPMGMALHDRVSAAYLRLKLYEEALEFHTKSLEIALGELGRGHGVTAGYLAKAGILHLLLNQTDNAIKSLTSALQIYTTLSSPASFIAQVHAHLADAFDARGDSDTAIAHAQRSRKIWEKIRGQMDPRSVASNMQTANLLLKPYTDYKGVLTPAIRTAYREAITCFEKVFRHLKNSASSSNGGGSSASGSSGPVRSSGSSVYSSSRLSTVSSMDSFTSSRHTEATSTGSSTFGCVTTAPMVGPAVVPPFAPLPPLHKSLLHKLTKRIVTLKLALVESPRHKEVVRTLRQGAGSNTDEIGECDESESSLSSSVIPLKFRGSEFLVAKTFDPVIAREVVIKMAAVSPSIYLDGVLARIDDEDASALDELAIAIQLAESETVGLAA